MAPYFQCRINKKRTPSDCFLAIAEDSKFNEDGSFIGQYGDEEKKAKPNGTTMV